MGFSINPSKPGWQVTTPMGFKSLNPLVREEVLLDAYTVIVPEFDNDRNQIEEHVELCVTHNSLLKWYTTRLMTNGGSVSYEVCSGPRNGIVVKCAIEKIVSPEEKTILAKDGYVIPNDIVHVESLGEASCDNCTNEISLKHQATTAENRSFDRAIIRYLSLDLSEFETDSIYSSSEEIGKPVNPDDENTNEPVAAATEKAASTPSWLNKSSAPKEGPPAEHAEEKRAAQPAPSAPPKKESPEKAEKPASSTAKEDEIALKFKDEREKAANTKFSDKEYEAMLDTAFVGPVASEFDGKTYREIVRLVREKYEKAGKTLQVYVRYRPMQSDKLPLWKCLISYLSKENLIRLYPSGKCFIGNKEGGK